MLLLSVFKKSICKVEKKLAFFCERCYYIATKTLRRCKTVANIKSAKKRVLVNATKQARNKSANSALKTAIKKANIALEKNADDKEAAVKAAIKKIDQAAAKGLLHKNNAARKKSALTLKLTASK